MKKLIKYIIRFLMNIVGKDLLSSPEVFVTYHHRPKKSDTIGAYESESYPNVGIVMQGPLKQENDFTFETIKLYKKYYPATPIIVSIWDTELTEDIERLRQLCDQNKVCISHFEKNNSINYQRITSLAGVRKAHELGCQYILKTRTDQRIYMPQVLSFLIKLHTDFPVNIESKAHGRIITCGMSTFSNRLYNISDMFVFGMSEDILRYYSCPLDSRDHSKLVKPDSKCYCNYRQYCADYSKLRTGEIWFTSHYIESLGFQLKWTHEDSDYFRRELFIIVDDSMLDFYWPKYTDKEYRWRNYKTIDSLHQVTFMEWYKEQQIH